MHLHPTVPPHFIVCIMRRVSITSLLMCRVCALCSIAAEIIVTAQSRDDHNISKIPSMGLHTAESTIPWYGAPRDCIICRCWMGRATTCASVCDEHQKRGSSGPAVQLFRE